MESLIIKASPKQLSKLRNGHRVRICKGVLEGGGFNLIVNPANYRVASKAFEKGKGVMIALDSEELTANRSVEGNGIFSSIKKGFKKVGKAFEKGGKAVGKTVVKAAKSKVGKQVLKTIAKEAITKGLPALATGAAALLGPEAVPVASAISNIGAKELNKYVEKQIEGMGIEGEGLYAGARNPRGSGLYAAGGGLYAGATRGGGVMGRGALLNVTNNKLPPALQSQNSSANFHFSTQLPPEYAKLKM